MATFEACIFWAFSMCLWAMAMAMLRPQPAAWRLMETAWPCARLVRVARVGMKDTDGYHWYHICFHIYILIRIRIRIVKNIR
jgi:hypothetical protein